MTQILWSIHLCVGLFQTFSMHLQLASRAPSTVQKYRSGWLKWRQWAAPKIGIQVIPAKPLLFALFISELTVISVSNNSGISSIKSVLYGI